MLNTLLIGGGVGIVVVIAAVLYIVLRSHRRLERAILQQEGWERAHEVRQKQWQLKQERRVQDLEGRVDAQVQQVQQEWQAWTQQDTTRVRQLQQQYESAYRHSTLEYELAHLPRTDETALPSSSTVSNNQGDVQHRQAARLSGVDLSERDLSHRYLSNADLREAHLIKANLFMADLSGASLVKADLSDADLSGANLTGADLRGAVLTGANMLVTDINDAILIGADLRNARNVTMDQLNTAIYDRTTHYDVEPDVTQPRLASIPKRTVQTPASPLAHNVSPETPLPLLSLVPDTTLTPTEENGHHGCCDKHNHIGHTKENGHSSEHICQEGLLAASFPMLIDDILATRREK